MLDTNSKGRSIAFSKALLTAVLLGGSALYADSAHASIPPWYSNEGSPVGYKCNLFDPSCFNNDSPILGDKFVTILERSATFNDNLDVVEFTINPEDVSTPWHLTLDFNPNRGGAANISDSGFMKYKITITDPKKYFDQVKLGNTSTVTNNNYSIVKNLYSDPDFKVPVIPLGTLFNPTSPKVVSIAGARLQTLYVWDIYDVPLAADGVVDNLQNTFGQTEIPPVPGPLPLVGIGAAFGLSRRIRSRIKGARLA